MTSLRLDGVAMSSYHASFINYSSSYIDINLSGAIGGSLIVTAAADFVYTREDSVFDMYIEKLDGYIDPYYAGKSQLIAQFQDIANATTNVDASTVRLGVFNDRVTVVIISGFSSVSETINTNYRLYFVVYDAPISLGL